MIRIHTFKKFYSYGESLLMKQGIEDAATHKSPTGLGIESILEKK